MDNIKTLGEHVIEIKALQVEAQEALQRAKDGNDALQRHIRAHGGQVIGDPEAPLEAPKAKIEATPLQVAQGNTWKITSIEPDPSAARTIVGFEHLGRPYKAIFTDEIDLLGGLGALLRGEWQISGDPGPGPGFVILCRDRGAYWLSTPKVEQAKQPTNPLQVYQGLVREAQESPDAHERTMLLQEARQWWVLAMEQDPSHRLGGSQEQVGTALRRMIRDADRSKGKEV